MACAVIALAAFGCRSDGQTGSQTTRALAEHSPEALLEAAGNLEAQDSLVEALRCYDSCVALAGRPDGDTSHVVSCLVARARLNLVLDLYARAQADAQAALRFQREGSLTTAERGRVWLILAGSLQAQQAHLEQADSASDSALSLIAAGQPPDTALQIDALLLRGLILTSLHRDAEAEQQFRTAVSMCAGSIPPERLWEAQSLLGWSLVQQTRLEEAEPLLLKSFSGLSENFGNEDPLTRAAAGRVASLYERWGKPDLFAHYQLLASPPPVEGEE